jgi:hypothetical protein
MATLTQERLRGRVARRRRTLVERPLWQVVGLLYAGIVLLAALVMTLAFSVAQALA